MTLVFLSLSIIGFLFGLIFILVAGVDIKIGDKKIRIGGLY